MTGSPLFKEESFIMASGQIGTWKIECDALTDDDWTCLARMLAERLPPFGVVEGVPRGGLPLADALRPWSQRGEGLLIVDDVWTTGDSMRAHRRSRPARGAVVFARNPVEPWVFPLWSMPPERA